jgi:hypothetical protein
MTTCATLLTVWPWRFTCAVSVSMWRSSLRKLASGCSGLGSTSGCRHKTARGTPLPSVQRPSDVARV